MMKEKVTIIGAGIGGLTTAIALQQRNIDFEIFESFQAVKPMGAGIMLANNAMQVMKKLDLHDELSAHGNVFHGLNLRDPKMNLLTRAGTTDSSPDPIPAVAIHRSTLQEILLAQIPADKIRFGKRLIQIQQEKNAIELRFEDQSTAQATLLIGADGIHSAVRDEVMRTTTIRSAQQNCWRGISEKELSSEFRSELNEIWGPGCRFGFVSIAPKTVYWYALKDEKIGEEISKHDLLKLFESFHPIVNTIIEACPPNEILNNPIKDLKPIRNWQNDRICLMGDAAHATTPNLGQGACQSIEDALVLADCLAKESDHLMAFKKFQDLRIKKATWVVNQSWKVGKLSHWNNRLLIRMRNGLLKNTPKRLQRKQNAFLFKLIDLD